jgi:hypothetical protein
MSTQKTQPSILPSTSLDYKIKEADAIRSPKSKIDQSLSIVQMPLVQTYSNEFPCVKTTTSKQSIKQPSFSTTLVRKLNIEKMVVKLQEICAEIYAFIRKQADIEIRNQMKNSLALQSIVTKDYTVQESQIKKYLSSSSAKILSKSSNEYLMNQIQRHLYPLLIEKDEQAEQLFCFP